MAEIGYCVKCKSKRDMKDTQKNLKKKTSLANWAKQPII